MGPPAAMAQKYCVICPVFGIVSGVLAAYRLTQFAGGGRGLRDGSKGMSSEFVVEVVGFASLAEVTDVDVTRTWLNLVELGEDVGPHLRRRQAPAGRHANPTLTSPKSGPSKRRSTPLFPRLSSGWAWACRWPHGIGANERK